MKTDLYIDEIKEVYTLLTKANCTFSIYISELAKELEVKKTYLMKFIQDNPLLFKVKIDKKGLIIEEVYLSIEDNPYTQEYLDKKKSEWANKLFVSRWDYYGQPGPFYIEEDKNPGGTDCLKKPYYMNYWLWRNTKEKMEKFMKSGHFHEGIGSVDWMSGTKIPYCLSAPEMKALIAEGWELETSPSEKLPI